MVVLGGGRFLMSEVPLYLHPKPSTLNQACKAIFVKQFLSSVEKGEGTP